MLLLSKNYNQNWKCDTSVIDSKWQNENVIQVLLTVNDKNWKCDTSVIDSKWQKLKMWYKCYWQ